jgi:hypothetical protein
MQVIPGGWQLNALLDALQASTTPQVVLVREQSSIWNSVLPALIGAVVGIVVSKVWSYVDDRKARRRERRRFLADQANRLMEEILRIFIAARNELGYLASELQQIDHRIGAIRERARPFQALTGKNPFEPQLERAQDKQAECIDSAYNNLKSLHAEGEHALKMLLSIPLKLDLSFLNQLFLQLADSYVLNAEGVAEKAALYDRLYEDFLAARNKCLAYLLDTLEK